MRVKAQIRALRLRGAHAVRVGGGAGDLELAGTALGVGKALLSNGVAVAAVEVKVGPDKVTLGESIETNASVLRKIRDTLTKRNHKRQGG
jgi:hypothetical protein